MKVRVYYDGYKDVYLPQYRWFGIWRPYKCFEYEAMGILIKVNGKVKVIPIILLDFNNNVTLLIKLEHNEDTSV